MGRLGIAKCTVHSISSQINQEGIQCTKAKKYIRFYCLIYLLWLKENWIQACTQWIPLLEIPLFCQLWPQPPLWKGHRNRVDKVGNFPPYICSDREIDNLSLLPTNQNDGTFLPTVNIGNPKIFDIFHIINR